MEVWKAAYCYADLYEVSNLGRVRNCKRGTLRKLQVDQDGYHTVILAKGGKQRKFRVARLVCLTFLGLPPSALYQADHINEVKDDDSLVNLRWLTNSDNQIHSNGKLRYFKDKEGKVHTCRSTRTFCKEHSLCRGNLSRLERGLWKSYKGWTVI